ncbi:hypothetical protein [Sphingobium sp. YR768]|uniref:hypothetical protein n=1 Tax=Sphingobium sp. YR768 TaxID=1884365 RepID=UPI0008B0315F|nr:hypothetical protein [Sphingobium sp. YR768]SER09485.1 hypothetical protein SAMN05518866_1057 [Sphingobium sp. YR768]
MRSVVILAICTLAACSDAGAEEEQKYQMVERQNATYPEKYRARELCKQGQRVADAYLNAKNEEKYKIWKLRSDIECSLAEL